ncbi:beta-ketoacyl synthase N-terminal-like domain-containing protein [Buchnera aphidicola (Ceratovacuna keduensis)]|uniref:beta-ketoacyl synthase N-terminal-like domain-containing protein n=1 Tax=Buchnera aphidicola TaxID=9 RepID=UPI0031B80DC9
MKRVVITGIGIISSIGNNKKEVLQSLKLGKSGISFSKEMFNLGMKSNVIGNINIKKFGKIDNKIFRFMNMSSVYSYFSFLEAVKDSKLNLNIYQKNYRVGLISGSGNVSYEFNDFSKRMLKKYNKIDPYFSIKNFPSNISACLSTFFKIYGITYSISSACTTSSHCICNAFDLIKYGKQDIIFAGGAEEINFKLANSFDVMKVLSRKRNDFPKKSSRAFDEDRDGFVISGGSGFLVLEELNFAISRNANIYAEIINYSCLSNGKSMILPSKDRSAKCMEKAINGTKIDYINAHATSTKIGDHIEYNAILKVFKKYNYIPIISSTKSMTGHSLGASGVHEIIYTILMMKNNFIAPSINIKKLDTRFKINNIAYKKINRKIYTAMSNNFGFGGTNVSIIIKNFIL